MIRWIARHGVVLADHVGRVFFWHPDRGTYGQRATYRRLDALRQLGLILYQREYGTPHKVIRVTREGARLADVGVRPAPYVLSELQHTLDVVALGEYLVRRHPGAELVTERELRAQRAREILAGTREFGLGRTPDGLLRFPGQAGSQGTPLTIAIELDLTRKDQRALERIVSAYAYERFDRVWWFVKPFRAERMRTIVRAMQAENRMEVHEWHGSPSNRKQHPLPKDRSKLSSRKAPPSSEAPAPSSPSPIPASSSERSSPGLAAGFSDPPSGYGSPALSL
jgi:hypothetical protein